MQYTIIRNVIEDRWRNLYTYMVPELPELTARTSYRKYVKTAVWYAKYSNAWCLEQTNTLVRWTDFIPIFNAIVTYFQHREYDIFCDGVCVGTVDETREKGTIYKKTRFVLHGKEYFIGIGNTNFTRPMKKYKWSIEREDGKEVASITNKSGEGVLYLDSSGELPIEVLVIMIMMKDIYSFSGENDDPITGTGF